MAVAKTQTTLRKAKNCIYPIAGGVSKRFDITTLTASSLGATVKISGGFQFVKSDGTRYDVFGADNGNVYRLNSDGTVATFHTGATTGTRWFFTQYNDKLIFCNRANAPRKSTDAAVSAVLGGSPPATGGPVKVHGNRVFFLEDLAKSKVTWSALNDEEDYTTASNAGSVLVNANDGSDLIDIIPSINEAILLKGARPYRLQGTSPSTYSITNVVPTTGSKGGISNQAGMFAVNDVWYLANNGVINMRAVLYFGDLKSSFGSDKIAPYFEPNTAYTVTLKNLVNGVGCYDSQYNRLLWGIDSDNDNKNDLLLVLDLHTNGWSTWEGLSIASLWTRYNSTTGQVEVYMGGYDGHVRVLSRDVGTNTIDGHARHMSALNKPGVQKSIRYGYFYFKEEGNFSATIDTKLDFGATGGQTYTASLLGGGHTLGVNWVLGVDPLGLREQIIKRIDLSGVGEFLEVGVRNMNAGEPFTWYGYQVLFRDRRVVRPSTTVS